MSQKKKVLSLKDLGAHLESKPTPDAERRQPSEVDTKPDRRPSPPSASRGEAYDPNPFDFVPFATTAPSIKTPSEWTTWNPQADDPPLLCTGYLDVCLKALTPLHIVGQQSSVPRGTKITESLFYQRRGVPIVPASTIRGCLRSFLEAACNGWASQLTEAYPKKRKERYTGFMATPDHPDAPKSNKREYDQSLGAAVAKHFYLDPEGQGRIDLPSYLFGNVLPKFEGDESGAAWKGRISIEDARLRGDDFKDDMSYGLPDIPEDAFMGGANPSASSWWYMRPLGIRLSRTVEFVGQEFRGRKFYYHQNPEQCLAWYFGSNAQGKPNWKSRKPLYQIKMQCLPAGASSETFRLTFSDIPEPLLSLVLFVLQPGQTIRHKLGYGAPYGYGSIEFQVNGLTIRTPRRADDTTKQQFEACRERVGRWLNDREALIQQVRPLVDIESLKALARILHYDSSLPLRFTYPPFDEGWFLPPIFAKKVETLLSSKERSLLRSKKLVRLNEDQAWDIADQLHASGLRRALHFEVYQHHAQGYRDIQTRTFS